MSIARKTIREYERATDILIMYRQAKAMLRQVEAKVNRECNGPTRHAFKEAVTRVIKLQTPLVNHQESKLASIDEEASVASELLTEEELQDE